INTSYGYCFHLFVDGCDCKIQYVYIFHLFQWRIHYPVLSRLAVGQTLMVNQLVDMEWKFGVTVGTSELQKTGNIFLQLKLVIRKGNMTENVYMELTLPQFYNFLHEMECAKASMDCFS
uniref:COMM domain-containing protein 7-like n=1 Tax=Sinocyclocheilus rhinocerous TaxID=307959 RepID=A0A673HK76_9TELE